MELFLYKTESVVPFIIYSGAQNCFHGENYYFSVF